MKGENEIWKKLLKAEKKARSGKFIKLSRAPLLYPSLMVFNYILYPVFKRGIYGKANTFFDIPMRTLLPSGTDIMLNGIKSHDSEIRLTKYLARELHEGDIFIDVGAHYGYYSLLASALVGTTGKVYSIEASVSSLDNLQENVSPYKNIQTFHAAAGDAPGTITFYEYPGPYAEYNTIVAGAYANEKWYSTVKEKKNEVPILILDNLIKTEGIEKAFIKIDVEGGESSVLRGLHTSLKEKQLTIAMEYLLPKTKIGLHQEAAGMLYDDGYKSYGITLDGNLAPVTNIDGYLLEKKMNSDNIVFLKN